MRKSEMNKTPVERLRSFLEIEDDELAQMSVEEMHEELRLLGINSTEFSASLRTHVSDILNDSKLSNSSISQPVEIEKFQRTDFLFGHSFQAISHVISTFFQFFSKTDRAILTHCSQQAHMSQTSIGAMVFITGVLAAISGAYAIYTTFGSGLATLILGLGYGAFIVALDRELVSFPSRTTVIPRLLLAVFIGIVVSAPLELKLFEPRINEELALSRVNETKAILDRQSQAESVYDAKINTIQRDIRDYQEGITRAMAAMESEALGRRTGRPGLGPVYRSAETLKSNYERLMSQSEAQLKELQEARYQDSNMAKREADVRSQSMADDFLSRREALGRIQASSRNGLYTIWGVRFLFILFQVLPILVYVLMPANDYMALVEAERRKAIARVNAIANDQLADIMNNPYSTPLPIVSLTLSSIKNKSQSSTGGEQEMPA